MVNRNNSELLPSKPKTEYASFYQIARNTKAIDVNLTSHPLIKFAECMLVKRHTDNWKIG